METTTELLRAAADRASVLELEHEAPESSRTLVLALAFSVAAAACAAFVAEMTGWMIDDANDATVTAAIVEEVTHRACIAQYGPGEYSGKKPLVCALGTYDVPATALSYPLARQ